MIVLWYGWVLVSETREFGAQCASCALSVSASERVAHASWIFRGCDGAGVLGTAGPELRTYEGIGPLEAQWGEIDDFCSAIASASNCTPRMKRARRDTARVRPRRAWRVILLVLRNLVPLSLRFRFLSQTLPQAASSLTPSNSPTPHPSETAAYTHWPPTRSGSPSATPATRPARS